MWGAQEGCRSLPRAGLWLCCIPGSWAGNRDADLIPLNVAVSAAPRFYPILHLFGSLTRAASLAGLLDIWRAEAVCEQVGELRGLPLALRGMTGMPSAPYAEGECTKNASRNVDRKSFFFFFPFSPLFFSQLIKLHLFWEQHKKDWNLPVPPWMPSWRGSTALLPHHFSVPCQLQAA